MKKFLFLGALAAMLLGTASCSNDMEPAMTDDGTVQFTIELPGNVDSRAISDGLTATKLQIAVYKEDGTLLENVSRIGENAVTMSGKKATVNFKLVKGLKYSFAFWAQNPGEDAYTFDAATGKVTVDYSKAVANVDDGDAFSNREMNLEITGPITKTITLTRPFAQLNYGDVMEDYTAAMAAGIDFAKTAVTVKQVATSFDIMNQTTASDNLVDVTWPAAASAIGENLNVENVDYKWLSMCYFLVPSDQANVETELSLLNTAGTAFNTIKVSNVPVQKNHRTNILGNLFTDDVNFNIIIDERFDQPDLGLMSDPDEIAAAIQIPGNVVSIAPGTTLNLDLSTIAEGVTINGNGSKLILNQSTNKVNTNGVTLTGFTIDNNEGGGNDAASIVVNGSSFNMKDCVFTPSVRHTWSVWLRNMSVDGVYNFDGIVSDATVDRRIIGPECKGTVNISNSYLKSVVYPISTMNVNGDCEINVTNTQLLGWTSFNTGTGKTYNFENCYFGKLQYGYFRPYGGNGTNTVNVKNCTFSDDYEGISPVQGVNIYITDSKLENGNAITRALIDPKKEGSVIANGNVYVDGTQIYNGETECER